MGGHVRQPGRDRDVAEGLVAVLDRIAVPLDRKALPQPMPAPKVRHKPLGQRNRGAALLGLPLTDRAAIENTLGEIDPPPALCRLERGGAYGAGARAGVERDQDELRHMAARPPIGWLA